MKAKKSIFTAAVLGLLAFNLIWISNPVFAQNQTSERLNVIMLDICSARADHFGAYGYGRATTPGMDRYAAQSVLFENALSEGSWCLPSYGSLLTGHVPEVHGLFTSLPMGSLPPFETTLAQALKNGGYKTALFSGGVYMTKGFGLVAGFDDYLNKFNDSRPTIPAPFEANLDEVLAWVGNNRSEPFFVLATIDDLHVPYQSRNPEKFDPGYSGIVHDPDILTVNFARAYNNEAYGYSEALKAKASEFKNDPRHLQHFISHYDAALNDVDAKIKVFLEGLKAMGVGSNTVVIISADHGEMLGEQGLINHTQGLYEPVLHVPLIIHHPGYDNLAGSRMQQIVQRIDLMPTILEIAGVKAPELELQGMSLMPLFENPNAQWRQYGFARNKRNLARLFDLNIDERIVRDDCYKLHHYLYKENYELYNICDDPMETHNLAVEKPDVVTRLSFELLKNMETSRPHQPGLPSGGLKLKAQAFQRSAPAGPIAASQGGGK